MHDGKYWIRKAHCRISKVNNLRNSRSVISSCSGGYLTICKDFWETLLPRKDSKEVSPLLCNKGVWKRQSVRNTDTTFYRKTAIDFVLVAFYNNTKHYYFIILFI